MSTPWLITCVGVTDDLPLLPHWLTHYLTLGIEPDRIVCLLNAREPDDPNLLAAEAILEGRGVTRAIRWVAPYTSDAMWAARRATQAEVAGPDDWVVSADVDEFHQYPEPLDAFLARCAEMNVACVQGPFIDRLAADGSLPPVRPAPPLAEQYPIQAEAAFSLFGEGETHDRYGTVKLMACRGSVMPSRGGHHPIPQDSLRHLYGAPLAHFDAITRARFRFRVPTRVHHYHWTATLTERLERRLRTPGVSRAGAEYGAAQLKVIKGEGGLPIHALPQRDAGAGADDPDWIRTVRDLRRRALLVRAKRGAMGAAGRLRAAVQR